MKFILLSNNINPVKYNVSNVPLTHHLYCWQEVMETSLSDGIKFENCFINKNSNNFSNHFNIYFCLKILIFTTSQYKMYLYL
jgi:hypothetical protein